MCIRDRYNMSHLVGEGVAHVQVFIGGFNNRKLTGKIAVSYTHLDVYKRQVLEFTLKLSPLVTRGLVLVKDLI